MLLSKNIESYRKKMNNILKIEDCVVSALIQENKIDKLKDLFLKNPQYINAIDGFGNTPMHYAILYEKLDIIKMLYERKVNLNIPNKKDKHTAMHLIAIVTNVVKNFDNLMNIFEIIIGFVELKGDLKAVNNYGKSPLCYIRNMLNIRDSNGNTLLMHAINCKKIRIAQALITYGCDINAQNNEKNTALHYAVIQAHNDFNNIDIFHLMTYMMKCGAVESSNIYGAEPFSLLSKLLLK